MQFFQGYLCALYNEMALNCKFIARTVLYMLNTHFLVKEYCWWIFYNENNLVDSVYLSITMCVCRECCCCWFAKYNHQSDQKTRGRDWDIEGGGEGFGEGEIGERGFEEIVLCLSFTKKHLTKRSCKTLSEFSKLGFFANF
jgi:hypothetical protein